MILHMCRMMVFTFRSGPEEGIKFEEKYLNSFVGYKIGGLENSSEHLSN